MRDRSRREEAARRWFPVTRRALEKQAHRTQDENMVNAKGNAPTGADQFSAFILPALRRLECAAFNTCRAAGFVVLIAVAVGFVVGG